MGRPTLKKVTLSNLCPLYVEAFSFYAETQNYKQILSIWHGIVRMINKYTEAEMANPIRLKSHKVVYAPSKQ